MTWKPITYAPWVPRPGMRGWFAHLTKAWGNPNTQNHRWPKATLEAVCERGAAWPIGFDVASRSIADKGWT
jgi:hypothetical protein